MQVLCFHSKTLASLMGNACEDGRDILLVEPIEGSPQTVVIEHIRADARTQKVSHRFVLEELWHQIELPIRKAQSIEDHGDGGSSVTHHALLVWGQSVQPCGHIRYLCKCGQPLQLVQIGAEILDVFARQTQGFGMKTLHFSNRCHLWDGIRPQTDGADTLLSIFRSFHNPERKCASCTFSLIFIAPQQE